MAHGERGFFDISRRVTVFSPAMTFAATANCARYLGAEVVFVVKEPRPKTLTGDREALGRLD